MLATSSSVDIERPEESYDAERAAVIKYVTDDPARRELLRLDDPSGEVFGYLQDCFSDFREGHPFGMGLIGSGRLAIKVHVTDRVVSFVQHEAPAAAFFRREVDRVQRELRRAEPQSTLLYNRYAVSLVRDQGETFGEVHAFARANHVTMRESLAVLPPLPETLEVMRLLAERHRDIRGSTDIFAAIGTVSVAAAE